jgi:hypothetical protein
MATFFTLLGDRNKEIIEKQSNYRTLRGTPAGKFFAREGLTSFQDQKQVAEKLFQREQAIGEGAYILTVKNASGTDQPNAFVNIGGNIHRTDAKGNIPFIDKEYMDIMLEEETRIREKVDSMMKYALVSDRALRTMLMVNQADFDAFCSAGAFGTAVPPAALAPPNAKVKEWTDALTPPMGIDVMCRPDLIRLLHDKSDEKQKALCKIAWAIEAANPLFDAHTHTKRAVNEAIAE